MFCSKCGKEIADNSAKCNFCGASVSQPVDVDSKVRRQEGMYSKEDYLTISEEYNKEKKEIESKYKKKITICVLSMALSFILLFIFVCMMMFNPMLGVLGLICLGIAIASAVCWQLNDNKRKKLLAELADTHYRKYINNYNK